MVIAASALPAMGIHYLTAFDNKRFKGWKISPVKGTLIVEGHSLSYALLEYCNNGPRNEIYGRDYVSIARQMDTFFNMLLEAGVNPVVVLDCINPDEKAGKIKCRRMCKLKTVIRFVDDSTVSIDYNDRYHLKKQPTEGDHTRLYLFLNAMTDSVK